MEDSSHWYPQPTVMASGHRITSRRIVRIMAEQKKRAERWRLFMRVLFRLIPFKGEK